MAEHSFYGWFLIEGRWSPVRPMEGERAPASPPTDVEFLDSVGLLGETYALMDEVTGETTDAEVEWLVEEYLADEYRPAQDAQCIGNPEMVRTVMIRLLADRRTVVAEASDGDES